MMVYAETKHHVRQTNSIAHYGKRAAKAYRNKPKLKRREKAEVANIQLANTKKHTTLIKRAASAFHCKKERYLPYARRNRLP